MGTGAAGMFETTMVAILVSAICALIREYGGFVWLLNAIKNTLRTAKAASSAWVSWLMHGYRNREQHRGDCYGQPIAADMAKTYNISRRKTASILDTFSCVFQGIIPYGAQMLIAIATTASAGYVITAFQIIPCLFYPFMLLISSLVFIFLIPDHREYDGDDAEATEA